MLHVLNVHVLNAFYKILLRKYLKKSMKIELGPTRGRIIYWLCNMDWKDRTVSFQAAGWASFWLRACWCLEVSFEYRKFNEFIKNRTLHVFCSVWCWHATTIWPYECVFYRISLEVQVPIHQCCLLNFTLSKDHSFVVFLFINHYFAAYSRIFCLHLWSG